MLCATPALRALRNGWPDARMTLVGLPWARELVTRFDPPLDDFVAVPGIPEIPEQDSRAAEWRPFIAEMRRRSFDVVVQLHGDGTVTNELIAQWGSRSSAGFFPANGRCPDPERYITYPEVGRERDRLLTLTGFLGMPGAGARLSFSTTAADFTALDASGFALRPGSYVCLHPGGREVARRWPPEQFAEVADGLARRGFVVTLTGTAEDAALTARVASLATTNVTDLAGRTDLGTLAALCARACAVVASDRGVAHLAEAVDVPSAILFRPSEVERWGPLDGRRHRVISPVASATSEEVLRVVSELVSQPPRIGELGSAASRWSIH
jgi:ADP-heptose:LPS heptosyltransferase